MSKKEKEPTYKLFDKEYTQEELDAMTDNQKVMIQHREDLMNKINRANFNLTQMRFGLQAFEDALKADLNKEPEEVETE
jgi:hypothetical protein